MDVSLAVGISDTDAFVRGDSHAGAPAENRLYRSLRRGGDAEEEERSREGRRRRHGAPHEPPRIRRAHPACNHAGLKWARMSGHCV